MSALPRSRRPVVALLGVSLVSILRGSCGDWSKVAEAQERYALFPSMLPVAVPALADEDRTLTEEDFMSGATEDRYPDIFRLTQVNGGGRADDRARVVGLLSDVPHHSIVLGHDAEAAADFLSRLTGTA